MEKKTIIKKIPDEAVYYDWENEVDAPAFRECIAIFADRGSYAYGDKTAIDIVKGDYCDDDVEYDYETEDELNKIMGGAWERREFHGYSQGDWADVWYDSAKIDSALLDEIESFFMGKVREYEVYGSGGEICDYCVFVPDDVAWKGKKAICEYLDIDPDEATVLEDDGFEKVYKYKEVE